MLDTSDPPLLLAEGETRKRGVCFTTTCIDTIALTQITKDQDYSYIFMYAENNYNFSNIVRLDQVNSASITLPEPEPSRERGFVLK